VVSIAGSALRQTFRFCLTSFFIQIRVLGSNASLVCPKKLISYFGGSSLKACVNIAHLLNNSRAERKIQGRHGQKSNIKLEELEKLIESVCTPYMNSILVDIEVIHLIFTR
jgi:hypothetical protein